MIPNRNLVTISLLHASIQNLQGASDIELEELYLLEYNAM
jgi:hypothetical protein